MPQHFQRLPAPEMENKPAALADEMTKAVITVVGKDTVGIIAQICTYLASKKINILDISQTIVGGFFNMMMIVDISDMDLPFGDLVSALEGVGNEVGVVIHCQKEDIFTMMHRI